MQKINLPRIIRNFRGGVFRRHSGGDDCGDNRDKAGGRAYYHQYAGAAVRFGFDAGDAGTCQIKILAV